MFRSDFRKEGVCSKSATKRLYRSKFLVSECIFKLVCHSESCKLIRDWLCVRDIAETSLNRLLLFLILKSSHRSCSVEKSVLKNFTGKYLRWSLLLKNLQVWGPATQVFFQWNLQNFLEHLFSRTTVSSCNFVYIAVREKETANLAWLKPWQTYMIEFFVEPV